MAQQNSRSGTLQDAATKWGQQRRLEFIDFRLYWEGRINRADLKEYFGISTPQASLDLAQYHRLAPQNLTYERRAKVYLATPTFRPVLVQEHSESYLDQLLTVASGAISKDAVFIGWPPPTDLLRSPHRRVSPDVLLLVLRAIRHETAVEVEYQSFDRSGPQRFLASPHAIAFDGFRWHARAYCHALGKFRDLTLARITRVEPKSKTDADAHSDHDWSTFVEVKISPHPNLAENERRAVEFDYAMVDGVATIRTRLALVSYLLRYLGIAPYVRHRAGAEQLILANSDRLAPYLQTSEYS